MNEEARKYLAEIGRKGGQKSRRKLTKAQARAMVRARTAKRAALLPIRRAKRRAFLAAKRQQKRKNAA